MIIAVLQQLWALAIATELTLTDRITVVTVVCLGPWPLISGAELGAVRRRVCGVRSEVKGRGSGGIKRTEYHQEQGCAARCSDARKQSRQSRHLHRYWLIGRYFPRFLRIVYPIY